MMKILKRNEHKSLDAKVGDLKDRSRMDNVWLDDLLLAQGEDWRGSKAKIKMLIKQKLGIHNFEIECAHRIGKEERNNPLQRTTMRAKFLN